MRLKYLIGLVVIVAGIAAFIFFKKSSTDIERFATQKPDEKVKMQVGSRSVSNDLGAHLSRTHYFCPKPGDLIKKDLEWTTPDDKWENYTPSSAAKILSFVGAQWVGVKVGKVICLYQTDEAVSFPVALEQTRSQLISEPKDSGWSALVNNRKFCKSASTVDCPYFVEKPEEVANVYKEIQYNPKLNN